MTIRHFKHGGLRFLRVGRAQFSFCLCKPAPVVACAPRAARPLFGSRDATVSLESILSGRAARAMVRTFDPPLSVPAR